MNAVLDRPAPAVTDARAATLDTAAFERVRQLLYRHAGVHLSEAKRAMVAGRLSPRLRKLGLSGYGTYLDLLESRAGGEELVFAIDALTTHETYFFREPAHFERLRELARRHAGSGRELRIWSAACSTGEEPYSIAMVLADVLGGGPWRVDGSDVSEPAVSRARMGQYPMERAEDIPRPLLQRYCLRGVNAQDGTFAVGPELRRRVHFACVNLMRSLPAGEPYDVIFLRNVLIYFDRDIKREVIARLVPRLRRGGLLLVGHSESLSGLEAGLSARSPSVYARVAG